MKKKRYDAIDGLRTIACVGIVMMHILTNNDYELSGYFFEKVILSFTDFVFLFMTISAFGMCCGYFEKILSGDIDLTDFYKKRYIRILPFFTILVLLDVIMNFSQESLFEAIADVTLMYGFFPHNISVIGVGWFLGVVFAFYIIFPFFCVLIGTKRRAWLSLIVSIVLNYILLSYFEIERTNIVYCLCYFILGGLIFQYKTELYEWSKNKRLFSFATVIVTIVMYYMIGMNTLTMLLVSGSLLIFALGRDVGLLQNRVTHYFSTVSMEVYLSHMVIFRIIEKLKLNRMLGNGIVQYCFTVIIVLTGALVFSAVVKHLLDTVAKKAYIKTGI